MRLRLCLTLLLAGLFLVACHPQRGALEFASPATPPAATVQPTAPTKPESPVPTLLSQEPVLENSPPTSPTAPATADLPARPTVAQAELCSPLVGIAFEDLTSIVSSPYDPPPPGKEDRHHGVDFSYYRRGDQASIQGVGVQAILPGVVAMALGDSFPYGNVVIIESDLAGLPPGQLEKLEVQSGEHLYSLYAHLEEAPLVQVGEQVSACQLLGQVGKSGNAGVAHVHLETRLGPPGVSFDRMGYYLAESSEEEKGNYLRWRIGGEFRHFDPMVILSPGLP